MAKYIKEIHGGVDINLDKIKAFYQGLNETVDQTGVADHQTETLYREQGLLKYHLLLKDPTPADVTLGKNIIRERLLYDVQNLISSLEQISRRLQEPY